MNALLIILFLSDTSGGRVHDKPIADTTPSPLPPGSRLLQDLGFLALTLPQVAILICRIVYASFRGIEKPRDIP